MSTGNNVVEEQPLLSSSKPPSYHDSRPDTSSRTQDEEIVIVVDEDSNSLKDLWIRKQITIYSVLTVPLLGLSILVILINFFVDVDDVKVCYIIDCDVFLYVQPMFFIVRHRESI